MKKLLFLTNKNNGAFEEDAFLIEKLKEYAELIVCHPLECEVYLSQVSGVIIRNIWPTHEYRTEWERIEKVIKNLGLPTYNPLTGKGDLQGKKYLLDLYQQGYPVIPTIDSLQDLAKLPGTDYYWIKPKFGANGSGAKKCTKQALQNENLDGYIIQPFIEFVSEPSFYFIDDIFSYAIEMPNRLKDEGIKLHLPTEEELKLAQIFIDWNDLSYGIERVDFVRTREGKLLLTEVEDFAEYLYLFDLEKSERERIAHQLIESIKNYII